MATASIMYALDVKGIERGITGIKLGQCVEENDVGMSSNLQHNNTNAWLGKKCCSFTGDQNEIHGVEWSNCSIQRYSLEHLDMHMTGI